MDLIVRTTYAELEDALSAMDDIDTCSLCLDEHEIKNESIGEDLIITSGPMFVVEDLGITAIEGQYCYLDPESGEYMPDFSVTVIYDTADAMHIDHDHYHYWEQDPPGVAIHNYLNIIKDD